MSQVLTVEDEGVSLNLEKPVLRRRSSLGLLAALAALTMTHPESAAVIRWEKRLAEKTRFDLEALEKARLKRERKAKRRISPLSDSEKAL